MEELPYDPLREYGEFLEGQLIQNGLKQSDLARESGLDKRVVSAMVQGVRERLSLGNIFLWIEGAIKLEIITEPHKAAYWFKEFCEARGITRYTLLEERPKGRELLELIEQKREDRLKALEKQKHTVTSSTQQTLGENRPNKRTAILGRKEEIAHIISLIRKGEKCITLVGTAGVGKTRLANEIRERIANHAYSDISLRPIFISIENVTDVDTVPGEVAKKIGVQADGSPESIIAALPNDPLLLVIDNVEHAVEKQRDFFLQLVYEAKKNPIVFLFTSRIPFVSDYECCVPIEPLVYPKDISLIHKIEDLLDYPATQLFYERARRRDATIQYTATDAQYITRLCQVLDGLPLAIEIVASHISKNDRPQAIYEDLKTKVLGYENRYKKDAPERHITLKAAIQWSYERLSEQERTLFCRLSIFRGGCTLDAAYNVCNRAEDRTGYENALWELENKSMLNRNGHGEHARYSMLQTIAVFAQEILEKDTEYEALRARFAAYYLNLIEVLNGNDKKAKEDMWTNISISIRKGEDAFRKGAKVYKEFAKVYREEYAKTYEARFLYVTELSREDDNIQAARDYFKEIGDQDALWRIFRGMENYLKVLSFMLKHAPFAPENIDISSVRTLKHALAYDLDVWQRLTPRLLM